MSTDIIEPGSVEGNEALTVGEKLSSFFKELSVGIDSFNARTFNKSIHKVDGIEIWNKLGAANVYFDVSTKHIPTPVMFNPVKVSFQGYVEYVLKAVPILKMVDTQADQVYRGLKTIAATGRTPFTLANNDASILINETRAQFPNVMQDSRIYTRAVNEVYPNFSGAYELMHDFNKIVDSLKSRDVELAATRANQVINIINILKPKIDSSSIILNQNEVALVNNTINNLVDNVTFAGQMLAQLSDLTRVLQLQTQEARKLV
jgi:hypothetical protein